MNIHQKQCMQGLFVFSGTESQAGVGGKRRGKEIKRNGREIPGDKP